MKKHRLSAVSAALCVAVMSLNVCSYATDAEYSAKNNSVIVSGSNDETRVGIIIMPYSYETSELTAEKINNSTDIMYISAEAGGEYTKEIKLRNDIKPGKWRVFENIGGELSGTVFFIPDRTKLNTCLAELNTASSAGEFKAAMNKAFANAIIGVDSGFHSDISEYLYSIKPSNGYDERTLLNAITLREGLLGMKKGSITTASFVKEYGSYLSDDIRREYSEMNANTVKAVEGCGAGIDIVGRSADDFLKELFLVAQVHGVEYFAELRDISVKYCKDNGIALPKYDALTTDYARNAVFLKIFDAKNNIGNAKTLTERIETEAGKQKPQTDTQGGTGSGGSGSSGGGGGFGGSAAVSGGNYSVNYTEPPQTAAETSVFSDVTGHWAKDNIETMYKLGIVNGVGDGRFDPESGVSRAEFVKMLIGILGMQPGGDIDFQDVSEDAWYYGYVACAAKNKIVLGTEDNRFIPLGKLSREDAAVMVYRVISGKLSGRSEAVYSDEADIADYAKDGVFALTESGILNGSDGRFNPKGEITRAETAAFLLRVYDLLATEGA